jgi:hypothetical protein
MIIEMRTHKTKAGCRSQLLEIFRRKSIRAHAEIGMKTLGPFLSSSRLRYCLKLNHAQICKNGKAPLTRRCHAILQSEDVQNAALHSS